jgi:signal transduction histidine kinase
MDAINSIQPPRGSGLAPAGGSSPSGTGRPRLLVLGASDKIRQTLRDHLQTEFPDLDLVSASIDSPPPESQRFHAVIVGEGEIERRAEPWCQIIDRFPDTPILALRPGGVPNPPLPAVPVDPLDEKRLVEAVRAALVRSLRGERLSQGDAEERSRLLSQETDEAAWDWDLQAGRIWRGGAYQQICGYAPEEIPGDVDWWRERVHPEDRPAVLAMFADAIAGERRDLTLVYRLRRRDESFGLVLDRGFVVLDEAFRPARIIGFIREIGVPSGAAGRNGSESAVDPGLLENERLERERLEALSRRLVSIQEEERRQIARELHDEIGQLLTSLRLALQPSSPSVMPADKILDELFTRVRAISTSLRPPMLDDVGLASSLAWHCERFTAQTGVRVNLVTSGLSRRRLHPEIELAVFRIVQEALTNVARHAQVQEAHVTVRLVAGCLEALIIDLGHGFGASTAAPEISSGLTGMRERASLVGGRLSIHSEPGAGTRVQVRIPPRVMPVSSSQEGRHENRTDQYRPGGRPPGRP